ncbi:hypothetical protein BRARA_H01472, partial [Brassica rapa]
TKDALLIQQESQHSPSCIHIPRQIPRNKLKIHESSMPIKTVDSSILKRKDRTVEIAFKQLDDEKPRPSAFCSEINTISPLYAFSDLTGHKFFDVCDCDQCQIDSDEEETAKRKSSRSKSSQQKLKERYESRDPEPLDISRTNILPHVFEQNSVRHSWKINNPNIKTLNGQRRKSVQLK